MRTHRVKAGLTIVAFAIAGPVLLHSASHAQSSVAEQIETPVFRYVGTKKCTECHTSKVTGDQVVVWKKSAHARAYDVLRSDEAKKIAAQKDIRTPPEETPACLSCHRTGAGETSSKFDETFDVREGVTCEACHGPGSEYSKFQHMLKHEKATAMGLLAPDAKTCIQCHNADSPTFKGFDYPSAMKKIAHPLGPF